MHSPNPFDSLKASGLTLMVFEGLEETSSNGSYLKPQTRHMGVESASPIRAELKETQLT